MGRSRLEDRVEQFILQTQQAPDPTSMDVTERGGWKQNGTMWHAAIVPSPQCHWTTL